MKNISKSFLCITLLFAATGAMKANSNCCDDNSSSSKDNCVTLFIPRSAGDDLVRQAHHKGYRFGEDCFYGEFSVEYKFQRNFREERIAKSLFGNNCLNFVGSNVAARDNDNDIMADNFGLSPDVNTKIGFCPRIDNHVVDFQLYLGLDEFWEGLYAQFNAPLVHSKWNLRAGSCSEKSGDCCDTSNDCCDGSKALPTPSSTTAFKNGYMDINTETVSAAAKFDGINGALSGDYTFGDMGEKWKFGRFKFCEEDETKLADFYFNLGYNFYECPDYHFGAFVRVVAPTGTELDQDCVVRDVFSPIIGQDHWRLGGGISAHAELYNCDDEHFITAYLEGYLVHMFDECQIRSFDFKDKGCMSRYMLLKEFTADNNYNNKLISAINFATRRVEVGIDVQGELLLEFVYNNDCGFSAGIGYNLYGRSEEDICSIGNAVDTTIDSRNFGIKGCAPVQALGFPTTGANPNQLINGGTNNQRLLASTESTATITKCGAVDNAIQLQNTANPGYVYVDSRANTGATTNNSPVSALIIASESATGTLAINTTTGVITGLTNAPKLVTKADLDIKTGQIDSQISHKIFGHLDYEWNDCDWAPYVRAGAEAEFARCEDKGTMNAWAIFVGGGVSF